MLSIDRNVFEDAKAEAAMMNARVPSLGVCANCVGTMAAKR